MSILNKLKPTLLVTSIMLLPTISYAMDDQDEDTSLSARPNGSSESLYTREEFDRAVKKALENKAPTPIYRDLEEDTSRDPSLVSLQCPTHEELFQAAWAAYEKDDTLVYPLYGSDLEDIE